MASEYGWGIDYAMNVPVDVAAMLCHAILHRKGVKTLRKQIQADDTAEPLTSRLDAIWGKVDKE